VLRGRLKLNNGIYAVNNAILDVLGRVELAQELESGVIHTQ
jgi:hypothetical protein